MVLIREAKQTDLPAILAIYNKAIAETTAVWRIQKQKILDLEKWFIEHKNNKFPVLVAEKDKAVIGFASYGKFRNGEGYLRTVEHSVYIATDHRNKGVGKKLIENLIQKAKQNKIYIIVGAIENSNQASHSLHLSLGFKNYGTLPKVGKKFNKWLDLTLYLLTLDDNDK